MNLRGHAVHVAVLLLALSSTTGCLVSRPAETTVPPPTPVAATTTAENGSVTTASAAVSGKAGTASAPPPKVSPVTADALLSAPSPTACEHPAGTFVDGRVPLPPGQGMVELRGIGESDAWRTESVVIGDLTGDGIDDAGVVINCHRGGVGWPDVLAIYTGGASGPRLLGAVDLGPLLGPGRQSVEELDLVDGAVRADVAGTLDGDSESACCGSKDATVAVRAENGSVAGRIVSWHGPEEIARKAWTLAGKAGGVDSLRTVATEQAATHLTLMGEDGLEIYSMYRFSRCRPIGEFGALMMEPESTARQGCVFTKATEPTEMVLELERTGFGRWRVVAVNYPEATD